MIRLATKYTYKDRFVLFLGDDCAACDGMRKKAAEFANEQDMLYSVYDNSKEVPFYPTVKYCEFQIVGNHAFKKLPLIVKAKREGLI